MLHTSTRALAALALAAAALPALADAEGQVVVRDAATGQLRAPTPAEAQALQAQRANARAGNNERMLPRTHASGAKGTRLTDASMSYSVLVRQRDGSFAEQCFGSKEEAEAALLAAPKTHTLPTE